MYRRSRTCPGVVKPPTTNIVLIWNGGDAAGGGGGMKDGRGIKRPYIHSHTFYIIIE